MAARLTEAVLRDGGDIPGLYAAALAEHSAAAPDVLEPLHGAVLAEFQRIYAPHAKAHYRVLRDRFDKAARAFAACAKLVDPGTGADAVIGDGHALQAWKDAATYADHLDSLLEPLAAAAELVRGPAEPSGLGVARTPFLLPLCADLDGVHKRRAWEAWTDTPETRAGPLTTPAIAAQPAPEPTRCGRWCRLFRIGAVIRAIEDPVGMELYGFPGPFGVKQVTPPTGPADNPRRPEWIPFDSEDDQVAQPKGPLAKLRAMARRHGLPEPDLLTTVADADDTTQGENQ
jgi:hypothetical protein